MRLTKGKIIRRKNINGIGIGPYMVVTQVTKGYVYARMTDMPMELFVHKDHIYAPKVVRLAVSRMKYFELSNGITTCITHLATKNWLEAVHHPEIACIYTQYGDKMYVQIVDAYTTWLGGEKHVKVVLGSKIYTP